MHGETVEEKYKNIIFVYSTFIQFKIYPSHL